jgi:hypothetical protein
VVRSELRTCREHIFIFRRPVESLAVMEHLAVDAMAYVFSSCALRIFLGITIYRRLFNNSLNVCNKGGLIIRILRWALSAVREYVPM